VPPVPASPHDASFTSLFIIMTLLRPLLACGLLVAATAFSPVAVRPTRLLSSSSLSVAVDTSEIKNGLTIEIDGDPYKVMSFSIMKQARGAAKTTIKMKNLKKGTTLENTYNSGAKFETAEIVRKTSQYTYEDEVSSRR
jgi:elongation factor P